MNHYSPSTCPAARAWGRVAALLLGLLVLGHVPLHAAPAPPDTVRIKRWLRLSDSLKKQEPARALALADSARQLARRRGLRSLETTALLTAATLRQQAGNYPEAAALAQQAYRLAQGGSIPSVAAWEALRLLMQGSFARSQTAEALGFCRQQLAVAQGLGDARRLTSSFDNMGNCLSENGQWQDADPWLRRAQAGYRRLGDRNGESMTLVNLAWNELYQKRPRPALNYARAAVRVARQSPDSLAVTNALNARAVMGSHLGGAAAQAAVADAEYALRLALANGHLDHLQFVLNNLSAVYEKAGRLPEALAAERRNVAFTDSVNSADVARQLTELNTKFGVEQQKARITQLTQQQRIAALRADKARAQARLWGGLALALAALLAVGGWLLRQVRRSRAQLLRSEAELRAANAVKDQANATKDQVMRIIGHDLRGPLATFEQFGPELAELANTPDPAEQHRLATALSDRARAVRELVDNLLNWARVQTGDLTVLPQPVRLAVVAQSLERVFGPLATAKGVALRVVCAPAVPPTLLTDPNLLGAVLRNLLGNAIKFTPGGGEVRLDIAASTTVVAPAAAPAVLLTITDTGRGMEPVQLAAALAGQPLDSTTGTNGEPGTGLGLAVVRHFAALLRAEWRGESEPGRGTRWTLALPTTG